MFYTLKDRSLLGLSVGGGACWRGVELSPCRWATIVVSFIAAADFIWASSFLPDEGARGVAFLRLVACCIVLCLFTWSFFFHRFGG